MRFHLRLQQAQARVRGFALELASFELERERLMAGKEVSLAHHRAECDPGPEEQALDEQNDQSGHLRLLMGHVNIDGHRNRMSKQRTHRHRDDNTHELHHPARQPGWRPQWTLLE